MRRMMMRSLWNTLSTSALVSLALVACNPPPHLVVDSGHIIPDAAPAEDTTVPPIDTGILPVDTGLGHDGGGHAGMCTYGTGGCNLTDTASCPSDAGRMGCYPDD